MNEVSKDRILKRWWLNESRSTSEEDQVKMWVQKVVDFFEYPPHSAGIFERVVSYYLLNFIKTYQTSHFSTLPRDDPERDSHLNIKFALFQAGIRLHETVNWSLDYVKLFKLPSSQKNYLSIEVTKGTIKNFKMEILKKEDKYRSIRARFKILAHQD
ncbi:hypothetical protein O181_105639 [Austropuccinia psidii MF-1]|uniref:Uncharacterized protein n=1 Tax=Austropuccinia psidii MF-1 TaxID=1389203 RepID=A0A9Q3PLA1_9BASI|nr:hypothetical protein [Austropuccinia psidii MF-1]